ncbi:MAG: hypothetical protein PWP03_581 [Candidatus Woesearchaeota archaeon]|nr:hypothetical protein [Candidatus Woesearchaeota archaeon]MDN5327943.1 hypothetical protein [Candidatus Woesearchaeota archaeon]
MKGVYLLLLELKKSLNIKVGSLGKISFRRGLYLYVGSAQNSLEKRIQRHCSKQKKKHWHIDYLTASLFVNVVKVYTTNKEKSFEQELAIKLSEHIPYIKGFGSTDSLAKSHLFYVPKVDFDVLRDLISGLKLKELPPK